MKKMLLVLLLGFSSLVFAKTDNLLFFQGLSSGTLTKTTQNNYILTVDNALPYVNYFTDRPERKTGAISINKFLALWHNKKIKNNFAENPPNAVLSVVFAKSKKHQNIMVSVAHADYKNGKVLYQLKTIDGQQLQSGALKHLVIFFDDIGWPSGGF